MEDSQLERTPNTEPHLEQLETMERRMREVEEVMTQQTRKVTILEAIVRSLDEENQKLRSGERMQSGPEETPANLLDEVDTTKTRNDRNNSTESGKEPNKPAWKWLVSPSWIPNWKRKKPKN